MQVSSDGSSSVGERQCDHFRTVYSPHVLPDKWEAWLDRSGALLPCESVITGGFVTCPNERVHLEYERSAFG